MKNWRTVLLVVGITLLFWFLKFVLHFPSADIDTVGVILTIASILFGFLAGFFISELWTRYTEIRELQGTRFSDTLNLIRYASYFFDNKIFEKEFKKNVEKSSIADEVIDWNEGHLEIKYFRDIEKSFRHIKIKQVKDESYLNNLLNSYNRLIESVVRLDVLYKERLFTSEWFMLTTLSLIVGISLLFLDVAHPFYQIVILCFPAIIVLALSTIYDLDVLVWGREILTMEPTQRVFDTLGVKRFYLGESVNYIPQHVKDYRTVKDLDPELKKVYDDIVKRRESKKQVF